MSPKHFTLTNFNCLSITSALTSFLQPTKQQLNNSPLKMKRKLNLFSIIYIRIFQKWKGNNTFFTFFHTTWSLVFCWFLSALTRSALAREIEGNQWMPDLGRFTPGDTRPLQQTKPAPHYSTRPAGYKSNVHSKCTNPINTDKHVLLMKRSSFQISRKKYI